MEELHHLIYQSQALRALSVAELERLRSQVQRFSQRNSITGILWYDGQRFLHVLEGPGLAVRRLFARVRLDCRHEEMQVLANGPIAQRQFQCWDMAIIRHPARLLAKGLPCGPNSATQTDTTLRQLLHDFLHTTFSQAVRYQS